MTGQKHMFELQGWRLDQGCRNVHLHSVFRVLDEYINYCLNSVSKGQVVNKKKLFRLDLSNSD